MENLEIDRTDVIKLIQQFLKENHLISSLKALETETQIKLQTGKTIDLLKSQILNGEWDSVINSLKDANLSNQTLIELYEEMIFDLLEIGDLSTARTLLRQSEPMNQLLESNESRYLKIEGFLSRTEFDSSLYLPKGVTKEENRKNIAEKICKELSNIPPSRLLTLLNQSLTYQIKQGLINPQPPFNLFSGNQLAGQSSRDEVISQQMSKIKFPKGYHPNCLKFVGGESNSLITGSKDGLIEVWNILNGKLRKELDYQANKQFMVMSDSVLALALTDDGELLASGSKNGDITVWKLSTGTPIKHFPQAHTEGVSTLEFSKTSSNHILAGGLDGTIKVFGMKSGKKLKEFRGHTSYINQVKFINQDNLIISASSDGSIKIWDFSTTKCVNILNYSNLDKGYMPLATVSILGLVVLKVTSKSNTLHLINYKGKILNSYTKPEAQKVEPKAEDLLGSKKFEVKQEPMFLMSASSMKGDFIYALHEDGNIYIFEKASGELKSTLKVAENVEMTGVDSCNSQNYLATFGIENYVKIWKS
ncbi:MGC81475 protein-like protein [Conidiobolus coronatus NRRL 28638]|uniref:WD40 repeat-containing protein SMU1 n=1 Tax=Conidiobolus coronatus (strain ATCC 28846 / CBS 209.66 / NRRL 28638) TaxID=796925 RepID=A0A137PGJ9_CONC2|nr:MGC81475 protein-like protein [Conidiobolus coronatus NRRL 28638]|eukprot:KXN74126.1 MGC81475 protein-like protein [Conidiobolus coronatus NRRL 28638]